MKTQFFFFNTKKFWLHEIFIKQKLATLIEGDPKASFSIATAQRCTEGRYSIPWIAPLYPWSLTYNAEC